MSEQPKKVYNAKRLQDAFVIARFAHEWHELRNQRGRPDMIGNTCIHTSGKVTEMTTKRASIIEITLRNDV